MQTMKLLSVFLFTILLTFYGCKHKDDCINQPRCEQLDGIEAIMIQQPEILDSLVASIDTTMLSPIEVARISAIKGLAFYNEGKFDLAINELENAGNVFEKLKDSYHSNINKLILAFTYELLNLDDIASKSYFECEEFFNRNHLDNYKFYARLGLLRMSKHLKLNEKDLIDHIKKYLEHSINPNFEGLFYSTLGNIEKNDSLCVLYCEYAKSGFSLAHRWSRVYSMELIILMKKIKHERPGIAQEYYDNFPIKAYSYTPTANQRIRYHYGQAYLYAIQGKTTEAINCANQVLNEAIESKVSIVEIDCVELLAFLYKKIGDYKNAHIMLERSDTIHQKLMSDLEKSQLVALGALYRYSMLENEKVALKLQIQHTINILVIIGFIALVIFSIGFLKLRTSKYTQEILKLKNIEISDQLNNLLSSLEHQENKNESLIKNVINLKDQYKDSQEISEILKSIDQKQITTWMEFETKFLKLRPGWIEKIKQEVPQLTATDIKYCMCIYFNLNNYAISNLCDISTEAIKSAKKRLRDKFSLNDASEIYLFLKRVDIND